MQTGSFSRLRDASVERFSIPLDVLYKVGETPPNPGATRAVVLFGDVAEATSHSSPSTHGLLEAVSALVRAVSCALSGENNHARQYLSAAFHSLEPSSTGQHTETTNGQHAYLDKFRGGLAPWQVRCVSTYIEEHLSETIHCEHLSDLVHLSLSHFMRAFRDSFGCPPHAYLMKRRMERAQGLMLTTNTALGQIALECGLADQSHLSRLFQRFIGESPAAWRRARATAAHNPK
jgi:AraC family transcriptional regulator